MTSLLIFGIRHYLMLQGTTKKEKYKKRGRPAIDLSEAYQVLKWRKEGKSEAWIARKLHLKCHWDASRRYRCRSVTRRLKVGRAVETELAQIEQEMRKLAEQTDFKPLHCQLPVFSSLSHS